MWVKGWKECKSGVVLGVYGYCRNYGRNEFLPGKMRKD
jgi:hypothetical protein